jgi:hypothetical protein
MNGWIESGSGVAFNNVKDTDIVIRTETIDDAVVICNTASGSNAAVYVTENRVGIGMIPRPFAAIDVTGSIFCDTKLELCASSASHPITYPRCVVEPNRMYFSDKPNNTPVVVDGASGLLLTDDVVVRKTVGVLSNSCSISLIRVETSSVASDIDISDVTFKKCFNLDSHICVEQTVTQIVQFSILVGNVYRVTLVPPIPRNIVSKTVVRVSRIDRPVLSELDDHNNKSFTRIRIIKLTKINNYVWDLACTGIVSDLVLLVDEYVAISKTQLHNYQHVVQIRSVKLHEGFVVLQMASPSLKNVLDLGLGLAQSFMFIYHIDAPKNLLWQKEFNLNISFVVDSNKIGYYLRIENTHLVNMLSENDNVENINAIDRITISDPPELYSFSIRKTYVQDKKALLYIDEQSAAFDDHIPTMFSGFYDIQYKLTGMPLLFKSITRLDECTLFIQCMGVQGYSFGDAMTIICNTAHSYQYLLMNDMASNAWRLIRAELGKGITVRCSEKAIVDEMMEGEVIPRVVYVIPFKGVEKPQSWHDSIVLNHGNVVFKDSGFGNPDTSIKYENNTLTVGPTVHISPSRVIADAPLIANDFIRVNDERLHLKTVDITDTSSDLEFINNLSLVEFDDIKRGVKSGSDTRVPFQVNGVLSDGRTTDDVKTVDMSDLLFRCIGAIQEISKKLV